MLSDAYYGVALGVESAWPTGEMRLALGATGELDAARSVPAVACDSAVRDAVTVAPASLIAA